MDAAIPISIASLAVSTLSGSGQIASGVADVLTYRLERARSLGVDVEQRLGKHSNEFLAWVLNDERAMDLLLNASEQATRTADERKRRLLVGAVAAAFEVGADDTELDKATVLLRTIGELDPMHIQLLIRITGAAPSRDGAEPEVGALWDTRSLEAAMPGANIFVMPLIRKLQEAHVIEALPGMFDGRQEVWRVSEYGAELLRMLATDADVAGVLKARLRFGVPGGIGDLTLHNDSVDAARNCRFISVEGSSGADWLDVGHARFEVGPYGHVRLELIPEKRGLLNNGTVQLEWTDSAGSHSEVMSSGTIPS